MTIPKFNADYVPEGYIVVPGGEFEGLLARPEFLALDDGKRCSICNGIGASTGLSSHFPNTVYGLNIKKAGDIHDYDYYIGGSDDDKAVADAVLLHNARVLIRRGAWILRFLRNDRVAKYYIAVRLCGKPHFNFTK